MLKTLLKFLLFGVVASTSLVADETDVISREYQLKTAYLFHFGELTEWPMPAPLIICLQGQSPLRAYLPVLEGLNVHEQALHVVISDNPVIHQCRILFLSETASLTPAMLAQAQNHHVLLVSDAENFARKGGMIQFALRDNKLKLMVNLASVRQAGLKLSSKLLRMAEILE